MRAEPILELACVVFDISVAMVALVDGERVFIRNCFGDSAMARPTSSTPLVSTLRWNLDTLECCKLAMQSEMTLLRCQWAEAACSACSCHWVCWLIFLEVQPVLCQASRMAWKMRRRRFLSHFPCCA